MKKTLAALLLTASVLSSCKNDLDVIDEWKETIVVFGLLNPNDTAQYIKINKAFLGPGNALQYAQVFDSTNYVNNEIDARLEKWQNGTVVQTILLFIDTLIPKDTGIFSAPRQFLYKTNMPIAQDGSEYKLVVTNTRTGVSVNAKTAIVQKLTVISPAPNQTLNLFPANGQPFKAKWSSAANGRLHTMVLRFRYREQFIWDTTQVAQKYIDWTFTNSKASSLAGGELMQNAVDGDNFYRFVGSNLAVNNNVKRTFDRLEFIFYVAGEDFSTYLDVLQATGSTFQDEPVYSNVNGGVGLFSCRSDSVITPVKLNAACLDSLKNGSHTYQLGFQ